MKLAKLSLAAIMAAGAFSFANATPLEDAIKGVELNGFLRYRYYNESAPDIDAMSDSDRHRFSAQFAFTMPVADNLTASTVMEIDDNNYAANGGEFGQELAVQQLWFKYATSDYSFKLGKQALNTPITYNYFSVATGNGALFMYTGVKNWTFAAAGFVDTDRNWVYAEDYNFAGGHNNIYPTAENVYAAAAIGSVGPVNVQLWGLKVTNFVDDEEFLEVSGKVAGFCYKAQYVTGTLNDAVAPDADRQSYYAIKLGYNMDGMGINGGYLATGTDGGVVDLAAGDGYGFIYGGINSQYYYANQTDTSIYFVNLSGSFGKTSVGAGYAGGSFDGLATGASYDISEWYVKAGYKYSKNFKVSAYYSDLGQDFVNNEFRFEAKYSF